MPKTTQTYYCKRCGPVTKSHVEKRRETYPVKDDPTEVLADVRICSSCGQDLYDRELDERNLLSAYECYRLRHHIVSPSELRAMRECYGLSQRSLGCLLGWGEITVHRYESGSLPDDAHNQVLRLIQDPFNMELIAKENGSRLGTSIRTKLEERLTCALRDGAEEKVVRVLSQSTIHQKMDQFTGYTEFRPDVLKEMIVFFATRAGGVLKTKLNKLLFYSDFLHFRLHAVSISGATYVHFPYGPVPKSYEVFLWSLYESKVLTPLEVDFGKDVIGEKIVAKRKVDTNLLIASALTVLSAVHQRFKKTGSKEISRISHEEVAYVETQPGEPISYAYADRLNVSI